jgi:Lrp/AsnC family transcriptional regulator, leucine-responsive regulatory protein
MFLLECCEFWENYLNKSSLFLFSMVKIDKKDQKLLYYLNLDGRMSHTKLSQKIGLSKNAVKYRIERLKEVGVIDNFSCIVNLGALGITTFTLLLKFNEDIYESPEIINYFENHNNADWVITLSGQWDIFAEFVATDIVNYASIIQGIINHFGDKLNTYTSFLSNDTLRVEHLVKDFYEDLDVENLPFKKRVSDYYNIDKVDKKIIATLSEDSSLSYLEIARRLNLTIDIVRYRMKALVEKGIIIKFFPEISLEKLGYIQYLYIIKLKNVSQEKINSLRKRIKNHHNIVYAFVDIHSLNIIFVCQFKSPDQIDHLSRGIRKEFDSIIKEQNYYFIKEDILFNLFPKALH